MSAPGPDRFSREWWQQRTMPIPETGCHVWTGFVCPQGYARTWYKGKGGVLVHRIAYELAYGPFDDSLKVCHRCDVPSCCNPDHLFLGTQADNLRDMFGKRRARPRGKDWGDRKEQIRELVTANPEISISAIAAALNLSYGYISKLAKEAGIAIMPELKGPRPRARESA